jgi:predicted deacylase
MPLLLQRATIAIGFFLLFGLTFASENVLDPAPSPSSETPQEDAAIEEPPSEPNPESNPSPIPAENVNLSDVVEESPKVSEVEADISEPEPIDTQTPVSEAPDPTALIPVDEAASENSEAELPVVIDEGLPIDPLVSKATPSPVPKITAKPGLLSKISSRFGNLDLVDNDPLIILGSEVAPGTSARLSWRPDSSFLGLGDPTPVLIVHGAKAGPRLCLTAAVHGDELNGIEIVRKLTYSIKPEELNGTVIGVPIVNLQGFRRASRYLTDRRDLNRYFPGNPNGSSASRIAHSLFSEIILNCEALIDLHTGSFKRTNLPQLRADMHYESVKEIARNMGSIVAVQSEGAKGSLRRAAVESGIAAVTLEAGKPHELQTDAIEHGVKSIESLMDALGMIKRRRFWEIKDEPIYYRSRWVRAKNGGILFSQVHLGQRVKSGDLLGTVTDPITNSQSEILSPYRGRVIGMALNQVMQPGFAAYHIGLQSSVEEVAEPAEELSESAELGTEQNTTSDGSDSNTEDSENTHEVELLEDSE